MITKILSKETCAGCRMCCVFLPSERWEMPSVPDNLAELISKKYMKAAEYELFEGKCVFKHIPVKRGDTELLMCPMLSDSGCTLGDDKPFECKIWPFRATKLGTNVAVTVSHFCGSVYDLPLSRLIEFYREELRDKIADAVRENPSVLTGYTDGYPIVGII